LQRDIERLLDLPQVFVEWTAEVGEPRVVVARSGEFQMRLSGFQGDESILSVSVRGRRRVVLCSVAPRSCVGR
jgi:hypothetical protein